MESANEMLNRRFAFLLWTCVVFPSPLAMSQSSPAEPQVLRTFITPDVHQIIPNLRVTSDLVLIPVTVADQNDNLLAGLERDQFRLYEDNVEQVITHFAVEDAPVSVGFVLDASGSMAGKLWKSKEAVASFLKTANPDDEFFLVQFSSQVELVLDMTQDTAQLKNKLMLVRPAGETALLDAVKFSLRVMKNAHNARKALIVVSDGGDNHSRYTLQDVADAWRESDAQVFAVGIYEPTSLRNRGSEEQRGSRLLSEITNDTAGRLFEIGDVTELPDVASKIGLALRNQYLLGYKPSETRHDGKYHRVRVSLSLPKGFPRVRIAWRHGYYAPND